MRRGNDLGQSGFETSAEARWKIPDFISFRGTHVIRRNRRGSSPSNRSYRGATRVNAAA